MATDIVERALWHADLEALRGWSRERVRHRKVGTRCPIVRSEDQRNLLAVRPTEHIDSVGVVASGGSRRCTSSGGVPTGPDPAGASPGVVTLQEWHPVSG
jgi:hypothetical protein